MIIELEYHVSMQWGIDGHICIRWYIHIISLAIPYEEWEIKCLV